jgi:hypothetical protein
MTVPESLLHNVPFFANPKNYCVPTAIRSALHFLDPGCTLTVTQLRSALRQKPGKGCHFYRAALALHQLGWNVTDYSYYGHHKSVLADPFYKAAKRKGTLRNSYLSPKSLRRELAAGNMIVLGVNYFALQKRGRLVQHPLHAVALTGYDRQHIIYHENGCAAHGDKGKKNAKVTDKQLEQARKGAGYEFLLIRGVSKSFTALSARLTEQEARLKKHYAKLIRRTPAAPAHCHS